MKKEVRTVKSRALGQDITYRAYGWGGKPVVAFPTSQAHENQWEDFGMVDTLAGYLDDGIIQLYMMDSIDDDTFFRKDGNRVKAMRRYEQYLKFITDEFLPKVTSGNPKPRRNLNPRNMLGGGKAAPNPAPKSNQKAMLTGCSMGAYHAANIFFRRPGQIDSLIALSGVYTPKHFLNFDGRMKRDTLANSPLDYLKKPIDAAMRKQYQAARLVFCTGQGDGEEEMLGDTTALGRILEAQGIPAWVDIWGQDVTHDWPWWQQQISYFLPRVINIEPR